MTNVLIDISHVLDRVAVGGIVVCTVIAIVLAQTAWRRQQRAVAAGWLVVCVVLIGAAVIDSTQFRPPSLGRVLFGIDGWELPAFEATATVIVFAVGLFLLGQVWEVPAARVIVIGAIAIALTNPVTEAAERWLVSNPENYAFVATDEPYRFKTEPSRQLARVSALQEISEDLSVFLLSACLIIVVRSNRAGVR